MLPYQSTYDTVNLFIPRWAEVRDGKVERNNCRFGYRFFTPKDCHWRSNWKKNMFNRWGHQKHNEKMWPLKKMLHSELKRKINNTSHVFFVSFSKGSSNTLLRFAESQWGEKLFGLADNNFNCYQTVLECLGIVSYKTDYFNAREIMGQNPSFALLVSRPYPLSICIIQRDGVHYNVSLATRSSFM